MKAVLVILFSIIGLHATFAETVIKDLVDCFLWGYNFAPSPESSALIPLTYTNVIQPLVIMRDCYHDNSCLFVTCNNADTLDVTCQVWPGEPGFTGDYITGELDAVVEDPDSWVFNTSCQYYHYTETKQHCFAYFYEQDPKSNGEIYVAAPSLTECYTACHSHQGIDCLGFTYYWTTYQCRLYNKHWGSTLTTAVNPILTGRSRCFESELELCLNREIAYEGDELARLSSDSYNYAYRNLGICLKRCTEYHGDCHYWTLDAVELVCKLYGPSAKPVPNIFAYSGVFACMQGLQCPNEVATTLYTAATVNCVMTASLFHLTWSVAGVEVASDDPLYEIAASSNQITFTVKNVTDWQVSVKVAAFAKGIPISHVVHVNSILYSEVPTLEKFEVTLNNMAPVEMSEPLFHRLPGTKVFFNESLALDRNVSTCAQTNGSDGVDPFFRFDFSGHFFIEEVVIHLMFYVGWPGENWDGCLDSEESYEACKDAEGTLIVVMETCTAGGSCVEETECGQITPSYQLSQGEQIYKFTCDSVGTRLTVRRDTPGLIRLCEIQINNYPQTCPGDHYLSYPGHVCYPCAEGYTSSLPYRCLSQNIGCDEAGYSTVFYKCVTTSTTVLWELPADPDEITNLTLTRNFMTSDVFQFSTLINADFTFAAAYAMDKDFSTFAYSDNIGQAPSTQVWLKVSFGEVWLVHEVTLYLTFKDDWFYDPEVDSICFDMGMFESCKEKEDKARVEIYKVDTLAGQCGDELSIVYERSQSLQTYSFPCDEEGDSVILTAGEVMGGAGVIRISEILVTTRTLNCTANWYLVTPYNLCVQCGTGLYSYGGSSSECTPDRTQITPSSWEPGELVGEEIPITSHSSWEEDSSGLLLALDKDLSTFYEVEGDAGGWVRVEFGQLYHLHQVVVYLLFYTDWFYFPEHHCLLNVPNYQECKDIESGLTIDLYTGESVVDRCGTLQTSYDLTQTGQSYTFLCDNVADNVLFSKQSGRIHIVDIVISTISQNCAGNHYLKPVNNLCLACESGYYSYGGGSTSCTDDKQEVSFSWWEPLAVEGALVPSSASQHVTAGLVSRALDQDLTTYSLALESGGEVWVKLEFPHDYFIHMVVMYQVFYTNWFYYPTEECHLSESNYQDCKDAETGVDIEVYEGPDLVHNCGTLSATYQLTQPSQIYSFTCDTVGDTVLLSKTSGEIKIYQVIVRTRAQSCTTAHHLNTTDNLCYPCAGDTYSAGGYTTACTPCPNNSSAPAGTAASENDCTWTWGGVSVEQYIAYDLTGYPLELKVAPPEVGQQEYGNITLTLHDQGQDVGEAVRITWHDDKIQIENLCSSGPVFESLGEGQTIIVASFGEDVVFHLVGPEGGLATFTVALSDCGAGKENYDMIFLSTITTLSARHSSDCQELDGSWDHVTAVTPSDLPAVFTAVLEIGCEEGYFNVGDKLVTCLGNDTYHNEGQGPDCQPRPDPEINQVHVTGVSLSSPLSECGPGNSADPAGARDNDLSTCSGVESAAEGGDMWLKLHINQTYINHVIIYTGFFDNWYTPGDPCVNSLVDYEACKDGESGVQVDVYLGNQLVKSCGTLNTNHGTKQSHQIYRMQCNAEGDNIRLSKQDGTIRVYEAVVTSQACALLEVEHGTVNMVAGTKHVTVTCDPNYQFYGGDGGHSGCINGTWHPGPYCLPTCLSASCEPSESCRTLHGLPLCYSDCGDPQAPLNGSLVTHSPTHATLTCDSGYTLLGSAVVGCIMETGLWEDGPWCSADNRGGEVYAITRPLFNATRLIRGLQIRWNFTASCPPHHIVKTCRCLQTEDFPGKCEGSEVSGQGTECLFTNSPSNNVQNMLGLAVCVRNKTIRNPCNYRESLPFHTHVTSSPPSHHPTVTCGGSLSHPTPATCHVVVRSGDVLLDWVGEAGKTSEVDVSEDGSCSVKCFDEGRGSCVLSLRCTARDLRRDTPLRSQYKAANCPTCSVMVCSVFERCLLEDGLPTCEKYCAPFLVSHGHVHYTDNTARITCLDKYYYSRAQTALSCNYRNGRWEPEPGRCILHTCDTYTCSVEEFCDLVTMDPPPYIHSYTPYDNPWIPRCFKRCPNITLTYGRVERRGRTAHVICPAYYYTFTGARALECLPSGEWSENLPTCEAALCEVRNCQPHQFCVEHAGLAICRTRCVTLTAEHGTVHDNNQTAEVECDSDYYSVEDDRVVTCQSDGEWSTELPSCHLQCPVPAESIPLDTGTQLTTFASTTTTCNQGYVLVGMATRTCRANGTWSGAHATCQPAGCDLVNCAEFHRCVTPVGGFAQCVQFTIPEFEAAVSSCLQTVNYEEDCDKNLAVIKKLLGQEQFVSVLVTATTMVVFEGPKQPYLISKKFLREIETKQQYTSELKQAVLGVLHHYTTHIKSLGFRENREVLVKQCMRIVNSVITSVQYEHAQERAPRTRLEAKQAWLTASNLHRGSHDKTNTENVFNTGTDSQLLSSLKLVAQQLLEQLRER